MSASALWAMARSSIVNYRPHPPKPQLPLPHPPPPKFLLTEVPFDSVFGLATTDSCFSDALPHDGQVSSSFLYELWINSNFSPQFLHLYSKIGIFLSCLLSKSIASNFKYEPFRRLFVAFFLKYKRNFSKQLFLLGFVLQKKQFLLLLICLYLFLLKILGCREISAWKNILTAF